MFILQLGLIGLCVALVPLSYVWGSGDPDKFRKLVWITTFLTLDLVMFGSFTRLTDSGLGCPDWPGCYASSSPFVAHAAIHAAEAAMPTGPVTMSKAWIEMVHRYIAMAVGVLIIALVVIAWARRARLRINPWGPTALLALVLVQGAFGAWTVTLKLQPVIVTTHLLLGLSLLAGLGWLAATRSADTGVGPRGTPFGGAISARSAGLRTAACIALVLLVVQIALGGWVSTNYAVLACTDFPTCNGQWVPPMDFANGFHLWRALGRTGDGGFITQDALVAIHWTHRTFAFVVFFYVGWLALKLRGDPALRRLATTLLAVLVIQIASGLSNILLDWPLPVAVAHNGGAAILLLTLVMVNFHLNSRRARAAAAPAQAGVSA
ncbi:COX15/CtaA family protein [Pararobbsia silviterrae]|uniref:Heme A synthase n=1 Tax=Pararobbsia silviterrae TaxID=1792498 RepID=A0A494Y8S4_9BURK|nr:COX15/CtaA family protein [Pararobbsia silviterrae]RKP58806.1 heme A synthase [Pararobbsia silviterrae]